MTIRALTGRNDCTAGSGTICAGPGVVSLEHLVARRVRA